MTQVTFDSCVVKTAMLCAETDLSFDDVSERIAGHFRKTYSDENLIEDIAEAARLATLFMLKIVPPEALSAWFFQLNHAVDNFDPVTGKRLRKKFFNGTLFNKEPEPIETKAGICLVHVQSLFRHMDEGRIPFSR